LGQSASAEETQGKVRYLHVLSGRNFLALWSGSLISRIGDYMLSITMITFIYSITHSPVLTGLMTAVFYIPVFLFSPFFGSVADNNDRKKLLFTSLIAEFALCTALYLSVSLNFFVLPASYISVFLISTFGVLVSISRGSLIPLTVSREELTVANSLQQTTTQLTMIFGNLLGGFLFVILRTPGILLLILIAFLISAAVISSMKVQSPKATGGKRRSLDGLKYVFRKRLFAELTVILSILNFTAAAMLFLPVLMSYNVFHTGKEGFAWILVALGAGTISGNFLCTKINARKRTGLLIISANLFDALLYFLFAQNSIFYLALPIAAAVGLVEGTAMVPFVSLVQSKTPAERLGSVLGGMNMVLLGGGSLSMISSGFLVSVFGVRNVYIIFAALLLAISLVGLGMKELRQAAY